MSAAQREREYSPSSCIGGHYQPFIAAYTAQSQAAHVATSVQQATWQTLHYGNSATQTLHLCLPAASQRDPAQGLLVFIHGGYWQELSALDSLFPAAACVSHGLAFAAINYTLAPHASLDEIVQECRAALAFLGLHAQRWGFDASNIVVSGSSAGAHLAAMVCMPPTDGTASHAAFKPKGAVLVSGIYALEPLIGTSINQALGLHTAQAQRNSPLLLQPNGFPPTLLAWGEVETLEFKRQSKAFHAHLGQGGVPSALLEIAGRNHFDVIMDLADVSSPLFTKTLALFNTARA
jgi:arylformamidase